MHIAVSLKEKDDSLQTFIEHVQYTNNIKNIIFHLSTTHQTSFSIDYQARARSARARRACALRALGLLLADGTPTVGGGKTF